MKNAVSPLCFALVGTISSLIAQSDPVRQVEGSLLVPKDENGYILDWDAEYTKFTLYGLDSKPIFSLPLHVQHSPYYAWAADSDGVTIRAYVESSAGKLDLLDLTGMPIKHIDTGAYTPTHVVFDGDHTFWTLGYIRGDESDVNDFNVVRHYSRQGGVLGEALPWEEIAGTNNAFSALAPVLGGRHLFISNDRLGFIAHLEPGRDQWIELSLSGHLLGRYELGSYGAGESGFYPLAMTLGGNVYARIDRSRKFIGYALLDRSGQTWRKLDGHPKGLMIGSEGNDLIFSVVDGGWTVLDRVSTDSFGNYPTNRR